jgi:hypothetical protein
VSPGQVPSQDWAATGGVVLGIAMLLLALFMALPVAVNLPDAWFGALLALALGSIGVTLVVVSLRRMRARTTRSAEAGHGNAF